MCKVRAGGGPSRTYLPLSLVGSSHMHRSGSRVESTHTEQLFRDVCAIGFDIENVTETIRSRGSTVEASQEPEAYCENCCYMLSLNAEGYCDVCAISFDVENVTETIQPPDTNSHHLFAIPRSRGE